MTTHASTFPGAATAGEAGPASRPDRALVTFLLSSCTAESVDRLCAEHVPQVLRGVLDGAGGTGSVAVLDS